jgi:hypothetical protein
MRPVRLSFLLAVAVVSAAFLTAAPIASASSVTNPSFTTQTSSLSATEVVDEIGFAATHTLASGSGTIAVSAPAGVTFTSGSTVWLHDTTTGSSALLTPVITTSSGVETATITVGGGPINAGNQVFVDLVEVNNPATTPTGSLNWVVMTSSDTDPVTAQSQSFSGPSQVSNLSVSATSSSANATGVSYTAAFTVDTELLVDDYEGAALIDAQGTSGGDSQIMFSAPPGSTFAGSCENATLTDLTDSADSQQLPCLSSAGDSATYYVNAHDIPAGDNVAVTFNGIDNPTNAATNQPVSLGTSAEPGPTTVDEDIVSETSVTGTSFQTQTSSLSATQVLDEVGFTSTGGLTSGNSAIYVTAPDSVTLSLINATAIVHDVTSGHTAYESPSSSSVSGGVETLTVPLTSLSVSPGDQVYVDLDEEVNPSATTSGSSQWLVATSSDPSSVLAGTQTFDGPTSVSELSANASTLADGATNVTYTAKFKPANALLSDDFRGSLLNTSGGAIGGRSTISFTAPDGTDLGNGPATLTDYTHPSDSQSLDYVSTFDSTNTYSPSPSGSNVTAGDVVSITISGVTNPSSTPSSESITITTSSDPGGASADATPVVIQELRLTGPGGLTDRYVELANLGGSTVSLTGWTLSVSDGSNTANISLSGSIDPNGHLLVADSGYASDAPNSNAAADITQSFQGVADNGGVQLLDGNSSVVDAVGFGGAPGGYSQGTALQFPGTLPSGQFAWTRRFENGQPVNTDDNRSDFAFVAVGNNDGTHGSPELGAPGPSDSSSMKVHNDVLQSSLLDSGAGETDSPNEIYTAGSPGTLIINRVFTNCSGQTPTPGTACANVPSGTSAATVTRLRFRITGLTTLDSPGAGAGQAVLKADTSGGEPGIATTCGSTDVVGMLLDAPSTSGSGGLNSTWMATADLPGGRLSSGDCINIEFKFDVSQVGSFSFAYNAEDDLVPVGASTGGGTTGSGGTGGSPSGSGGSPSGSGGLPSGSGGSPSGSGGSPTGGCLAADRVAAPASNRVRGVLSSQSSTRAAVRPAAVRCAKPSTRGRAFLRVSPRTVTRGHGIRITGAVGPSCPAARVTLGSRAFVLAARGHRAAVAGSGRFSATVRIPKTKRAGSYTISARCGMHVVARARLRVRR